MNLKAIIASCLLAYCFNLSVGSSVALGQDLDVAEISGLRVGMSAGMWFPTHANKKLGSLFVLGAMAECRIDKNAIGLYYNGIWRGDNLGSSLFVLGTGSVQYPIQGVVGSMIGGEYGRELFRFKRIFLDGLLDLGYSFLDYEFSGLSNSIERKSWFVAPGISFWWCVTHNGDGSSFIKLSGRYTVVDLAPRGLKMTSTLRGNYVHVALTFGLGVR